MKSHPSHSKNVLSHCIGIYLSYISDTVSIDSANKMTLSYDNHICPCSDALSKDSSAKIYQNICYFITNHMKSADKFLPKLTLPIVHTNVKKV